MPYWNSAFWGMDLVWWLFWVVAIVIFFAVLVPIPRARLRDLETPLEILRRRYAAGELTTEEYDERKSRLLDERADTSLPSRMAPPSGHAKSEHIPH